MYLKKLRLQNIKCFEDVTLEFPHKGGDYSGWNVILGENGYGKTTILRSIALGVLPPSLAFAALEESGGHFARTGGRQPCRVTVDLQFHTDEALEPSDEMDDYVRSLTFFAPDGAEVALNGRDTTSSEPLIASAICYGYGPFRRLSGPMGLSSSYKHPQPLSRFATLFSDRLGLPEASRGLTDLYIAKIDDKHSAHSSAVAALEGVKEVINGLLPDDMSISDITSEGVAFNSSIAIDLNEQDLSDGYRSFLSLAFDLLRHLSSRFGRRFQSALRRVDGRAEVDIPGVVLIDEADAHLHPSWQRELGERLCRVFPKIQFIVTTHSPFIAQEARDNGLFVLTRSGNRSVVVEKPIESVRGWTASQILTSPLFGLDSTRDPETESLVQETTALASKEKAGKLTAVGKQRLSVVRDLLTKTLSAPGETYDEMRQHQNMDDYVQETLKRLKNGKP